MTARGEWGPAGEPAPRWLPRTGPADVARRLEAVGWAGERAAFARNAAQRWGEWPAEGLGVSAEAVGREARRYGVSCAWGAGRILVSGASSDLYRLGQAVEGHPQWGGFGSWLRQDDTLDVEPGLPRPVAVGRYRLSFGWKTYVVGIVNRTPNSFSDGTGALPGVAETVEAAWAAYRQGADIVDLGCESSEERDGGGIDPAEEQRRLLPVLEGLTDLPAIISLDTRRSELVRAAARWGTFLVNDVDALRDAALGRAVAEDGLPVVLMHRRTGPPSREGIVAEVRTFFLAALERGLRAGIRSESVILDPGFGFGTTVDEDLQVTRSLGSFRALGRPLLHAPSRKRTIGRVLAFPETIPERIGGTSALVALGIAGGADMVRVHDVEEMARVARMSDAVLRPGRWRRITAP